MTFYSNPKSDNAKLQATSRLYHRDPHVALPVVIHDLGSPETIDEHIKQMLANKEKVRLQMLGDLLPPADGEFKAERLNLPWRPQD